MDKTIYRENNDMSVDVLSDMSKVYIDVLVKNINVLRTSMNFCPLLPQGDFERALSWPGTGLCVHIPPVRARVCCRMKLLRSHAVRTIN